MVRPVLNPGRLLEPVSDCWPRGMIVHDRTRLNGQLPRQKKARVASATRAFAFLLSVICELLYRQIDQQCPQWGAGRNGHLGFEVDESPVSAHQFLHLLTFFTKRVDLAMD